MYSYFSIMRIDVNIAVRPHGANAFGNAFAYLRFTNYFLNYELRITNLDVRAPLAQTSEAEVPIKNLPVGALQRLTRRVGFYIKVGLNSLFDTLISSC